MGALVSRAQFTSVREGLEQMLSEAQPLFDGRTQALVDADPAVAACAQPVLLGTTDPVGARVLHEVEVFGPVATLMPYDNEAQAYELIRRGQGSLVASVYSADPAFAARAALELADSHGRVHAISPEVAQSQTGHGNVMPHSQHGGPGRAGGGEELGGLRALNFYHRRSAVQAHTGALDALATQATTLSL
jgi:3,4-dehydroadipyl-CoA semialdehyde dehydrogenase